MDRKERFLMRQRGAGARKLHNSGFELELPGLSNASLKPVGSGKSRRTPLSSRSNTQRTPPVPQKSSRRTPILTRQQITDEGDPSRGSATSGVRCSSSRKRKLGTIVQGEELSTASTEQEHGGPLSLVDRTTKKRKKRKSIGQNSKKRVKTNLQAFDEEPPLSLSPTPAGPVTQNHEKETVIEQPIAEMMGDAKLKKRKKRKSIGQNSKKRVRRSSLSNTPKACLSLPNVVNGPLIEGDSPAKPKKPVKRRSMVILPDGERKVLSTSTTPAQNVQDVSNESMIQPSPDAGKALEPVKAKAEEEAGEEIEQGSSLASEPQAEKPVVKPRSSSSSRRPPKKRVIEAKKATKSSILHPNPYVRKARRRSPPLSSEPHENRSKKHPSNAIPITVHRLSRPQALETIAEGDEISVIARPLSQRSGVNAIDVLSQICREIVAKAVDNMKQTEASAQGAERKAQTQKRKAVEMFGEELDARLFLMTEALDMNHTLSNRLRHATREKANTRSKLQKLKNQRYEIIREIEEVRAEHERKSRLAQEKMELITMIEDIELAVQRGRSLQHAMMEKGEMDGADPRELGLRLKRVGEKVCKVGGWGLLERVKGFNEMVESALEVL